MNEIFKSIEKFFLDFIGVALPGATLIIGLWLIFINDFSLLPDHKIFDAGAFWIIFIISSYITGHGITSISKYLWDNKIILCIRKTPLICNVIEMRSEIDKQTYADQSFRKFKQILVSKHSEFSVEELQDMDVRYWRNIALTLTPEYEHKVDKFMFLAILNFGIATVIVLLVFIYLITSIIGYFGVSIHDSNLVIGLVLIFLLFLVNSFLERGSTFYKRSIRLPFSIAMTSLLTSDLDVNETKKNFLGIRKVYLAGGMYSGWQDRIIRNIKGFEYFDPRSHKFESPAAYTQWDLTAIKQADLVFAYLEETNPSGYALAVEIGFAKALNIPIILVDEKSSRDKVFSNKLGMVNYTADVVFGLFEEGFNYLKELEKL